MLTQIPNNWQEDPISRIANIDLGGTPSRNNEAYWNGDIKWLAIQDIVNSHGRYVKNSAETITEEGLNRSAAKLLPRDTVVISARGTVGEIALLAEPMAFNQSCYGLTAKNENELDQHYLYYAVKNVVKRSKGLAHGGVFNTFTKTTFDHIKILLPRTTQEQKRIASIVSAFDEKIEVNNRIAKTLEQMGQAIFKEWFVKFRFPGHDKVKFTDSELGRIPETWKVGSLKNVVDLVSDRYLGDNKVDRFPYLPIDLIQPKTLLLKEIAQAEEAKSSLVKFTENDILFGAMRPYFFKVSVAPFDGLSRTTCFVLRPKDKSLAGYSVFSIFRQETVDYATNLSQGSTIPYARWEGALADMKMVEPEQRLLNVFNDISFPIVEKIKRLFFENQKLTKTRDLFLPKLMRGEIRV